MRTIDIDRAPLLRGTRHRLSVNNAPRLVWSWLVAGALWWAFGQGLTEAGSPIDSPSASWQDVLLDARSGAVSRARNAAELEAAAERVSARLAREFPLAWDWCLQDVGPDFQVWFSGSDVTEVARRATTQVFDELRSAGKAFMAEFEQLVGQGSDASPEQWLDLYSRAAGLRRNTRLQHLRREYPRWIFTKHAVLGGSHYAYTEGLSDAQHERQFEPGSALCELDLAEDAARIRNWIEDSGGVLRDPDVSWDGERVLFAWKKSDRGDDYHLYELRVADGAVRQLTHGLGYADYEGAYLPTGDVVFNSTRCVQTVDCWWTEVSNLYTCGSDGQGLRRLTFDQVHDNYPTVLPDGRVVYTRWEYNDRGQIFVQGLFQMNADGTGQTEFYGNNSWFPTSLLHARGIPGTGKVVAIFSGHHTQQVGKLGIVDPARGRQENAGARLIAPDRDTPADRIDAYGQDGELFQYPYPLSESEFVVAGAPLGWARSPIRFNLYWVAADGRRELLAADPEVSCGQPVPMVSRRRPAMRATTVDLRSTNGSCYIQDVYSGPGLAGVERGTVKRLRVIALDYRAAGVGWNYNAGPAGDALVSTPVSIGNGSWDAKIVLGEATVYRDGSAYFTVPARTPVYFQAIDWQGCAVQTMRSWVTLQPGENASCVGCHEPKNSAPPLAVGVSEALWCGAEALVPFHGPARGFSFLREIQPVLDRHCVRCHEDESRWEERTGLTGVGGPVGCESESESESEDLAFSLKGTAVSEELAGRQWSASYLALVNVTERVLEGNRYLAGQSDALVNWVSAQSNPAMHGPYAAGSARSGLITMLREGHHGVKLAEDELERLACWIDLQVPFCGDYQEANLWRTDDRDKYERFLEKRRLAAGEGEP